MKIILTVLIALFLSGCASTWNPLATEAPGMSRTKICYEGGCTLIKSDSEDQAAALMQALMLYYANKQGVTIEAADPVPVVVPDG